MNPAHTARVRRNILISCLIFSVGVLGWYAVISGSLDVWLQSLSEVNTAQIESTHRGSDLTSRETSRETSPSQAPSADRPAPPPPAHDRSPSALLAQLGLAWAPLAGQPRSLLKSEITVHQYELCQDVGVCEQRAQLNSGLYGECITRSTELSSRESRAMNCLSYGDVVVFAGWIESLYRAQLRDAQERSELSVGLPTLEDWRAAWGAARYPWGDARPSCERAVFFEGGPACGGALAPATVCSTQREFKSDPCDLAGNLWEWLAWEGSQGESSRGDKPLITGGGWSSDGADLRRDHTRSEARDMRAPHIGARLVITLSVASIDALERRELSKSASRSGQR